MCNQSIFKTNNSFETMTIQKVHDYLKNHDIRPLPHKVAIMKYLLERFDHPSIDQIYNDLLPSMPTLSKTTVYNTLKLFGDKKAVLSLFIDEKNMRYDAHTHAHAHFRCKKCSTIYDISIEETDIPPFRGSEDFLPEETQIYFLGACGECRMMA